MTVLVAQMCPTLCGPIDRSRPGSSVCGILQSRILVWVAMPSSRGPYLPRDWTRVSCIAGRLSSELPGKPSEGGSALIYSVPTSVLISPSSWVCALRLPTSRLRIPTEHLMWMVHCLLQFRISKSTPFILSPPWAITHSIPMPCSPGAKS